MTEVDYNRLFKIKQRLENLYVRFQTTHEEFLKVVEDTDCFDAEKIDQIHTVLLEYDSEIDKLNSQFYILQSKNKDIQACFNETRLLKKARLTKLASNMKRENDYGRSSQSDDDDTLPF